MEGYEIRGEWGKYNALVDTYNNAIEENWSFEAQHDTTVAIYNRLLETTKELYEYVNWLC